MDALWNTLAAVNAFFQSLGAWLTQPMAFFSFLGSEDFFLLFMPALYWCVSSVDGLRIAVILTLSNAFSSALKMTFRTPRPYWIAPETVQALAQEGSFGFPSGHSLNSASIWGLSAWLVRRRGWLWLLPAALILFVGLSRIYLGVHFITDVLGGWLFGLLLVWLFVRLERPIMSRVSRLALGAQVLLAAALAALIVLVNLLVRWAVSGWVMPAAWQVNAGHALTPFDMAGVYTVAGTTLGLLAGVAWLWKRGGFSAAGTLTQRLARYVIGVAGVLVFYLGLKMAFSALAPVEESALGVILRLVRYTLVGLWISALAPLVFMRLKLAQPLHPVKDASGEAVTSKLPA